MTPDPELQAKAEEMAKRLHAWPEPPGRGLTIHSMDPLHIAYVERRPRGVALDVDALEQRFADYALRGALQERARATHETVTVAFFTTTRDPHDAIDACLGRVAGPRA